MAATYDYRATTTDMYDGSVPYTVYGVDRQFYAERTINFATAVADLTSGVDFIANDVLELISIPANTWVYMVAVTMDTVSDAINDVNIGDGTDTSGYIDAIDMTSTGTSTNLITSTYSIATAGGKIYTSADTIDAEIIGSVAADDGIFTIKVMGWDIS